MFKGIMAHFNQLKDEWFYEAIFKIPKDKPENVDQKVSLFSCIQI